MKKLRTVSIYMLITLATRLSTILLTTLSTQLPTQLVDYLLVYLRSDINSSFYLLLKTENSTATYMISNVCFEL